VHLVLSGEGNSDIGRLSYKKNTFEPAPMYFLIDKILENNLHYSIYQLTPDDITFIPKVELMRVCKSMKSFPSKKNGQETQLFYKNAMGLSRIAKLKSIEKKDTDAVVVLFRDSDGTNTSDPKEHDNKIKAIEFAFKQEEVSGIAMVPRPKSEAWLICALKDKPYENCKKLEGRSGNDDSPHNLKDELSEILKSKNKTYYNINDMIQNNEIDIEKIDMPSFKYFKNKLENILS